MKKKIYLLALLIIIGGAIVYTSSNYMGNVTEQNLKSISITNIDHSNTSIVTTTKTTSSADGDQGSYALVEKDKDELFESLTSLIDIERTNDETIESEYEFKNEFNLLLKNRWGRTAEYRVLYTEDMSVYLHNQQDTRLYMVDVPNFFYNHEGFAAIYHDRFSPTVQISAGNKDIPFTITEKSWKYQRYDGQWINQNYASEVDSASAVFIPSISSSASMPSISSNDDLVIATTDKKPDRTYVVIRNQSTNVVEFQDDMDENWDLKQLPYPDSNGSYEYEILFEWNSESNPYRGRYAVNFPVVFNFPETFEFSKQQIIQGDVLEILANYVGNPEDIYFEQSIYKGFRWSIQGEMIRGYIPTNYSTKPGLYEIKYGNRKTGTEFIEEIEVVAHDYRIQYMYIDESIAQETRNEAAYVEFAKYFTPVRNQSASERYYTEPFLIPAKGRLTTEFGQTRYVNDAPTSSRHSGLDIAAPTGTEIIATNRGEVVLAMPLILTGNTIVIDHGEGLFSVYFHMHENVVSVGEIVERGQKIATIGTTGFSTGPHLHFTISYYTMNVEPGFLLVGQPITLSNYREFLE